jgi:hypothetical protein
MMAEADPMASSVAGLWSFPSARVVDGVGKDWKSGAVLMKAQTIIEDVG